MIGCKPVLSYNSKPHIFSTYFEEEMKTICIYSLQQGHKEAHCSVTVQIHRLIGTV